MKKHLFLFFVLLLTAASIFFLLQTTASADFRIYPGAKLDARATRDANSMSNQSDKSSKCKVYTTGDPFEKVAAFYKGIAKEYVMPGMSKKGPQAAFFIFDKGKDLADSKRWIKVQRPALGLYKEDVKAMKFRDITVIILVEK